MKVGRWILLAAAVGGAAYFGATRYEKARAAMPTSLAELPADARAPEGIRIKVEVLNATKVKGLARRATQLLRDRGFDVVAIGTATQQKDETTVIDRSGHPDWARLIGNALGATVTTRPDSSRYVDATVLIGANWRPPPGPFYP